MNTGHKLRGAFYWARLMKLQNKHSMHVPINCCDKGLTIFHVSPIIINTNASIGKNCSISPFAAVVNSDIQDLAPQLGDNINLGCGCKILGNIVLADGISVGAGAVVTKSFGEPGIHLAGVPAKKIN